MKVSSVDKDYDIALNLIDVVNNIIDLTSPSRNIRFCSLDRSKYPEQRQYTIWIHNNVFSSFFLSFL